MTLIKKTVILSSDKVEGYCSIICVGRDCGAKIVGNNFTDKMTFGIRIGEAKPYFNHLNGKKTEINIPLFVKQTDDVGCIIFQNGEIFAKGGLYVNMEDASIENSENETSLPVTSPSEEPTVSEEAEKTIIDEADLLTRLGGNKSDFYAEAKDKIDELFIVYPPEKNLEKAIPDSTWVKINYDGEDFYAVGRLLDEGKVAYIAYGVPGTKEIVPPKITEGYADWLPIENIKPYDGYWIILQHADTGKLKS